MSSILALSGVLSADIDQQITWFQSKGLLASTKNCPVCSHGMTLQPRSDITDQYRYRVAIRLYKFVHRVKKLLFLQMEMSRG